MSEETKVTMKIPLFEEGEIEKIDRFTSEIAREINGKVLKEKEMIIAQRLIHNLQERIDKAIEKLKEHKYDLDYEPWSEYKISGNILFDLVNILKGSDDNDNS